MDPVPVKAISDLATDYAKLATFVYALVELYKDILPNAGMSMQRLAAYVCGGLVAGLTVWQPGMRWQEYVGLVLFNGLTLGMMAIGLHQTVSRGGDALTKLGRKDPAAGAPPA